MYLFRSFILFVVISITVLFSACSGREPQFVEITEDEIQEDLHQSFDEEAETDSEKQEQTIFVHISGQVSNPGLYELRAGSRLNDAVLMAGGFTEEADINYSNLAEVLEDGRKYQIFSYEETAVILADSEGESSSGHYDSDGRLDINLADVNELMNLQGVGQSKANAIVEYREINGAFNEKEDIMKVSGIGEGLYQKISAAIIVR